MRPTQKSQSAESLELAPVWMQNKGKNQEVFLTPFILQNLLVFLQSKLAPSRLLDGLQVCSNENVLIKITQSCWRMESRDEKAERRVQENACT